MISSFYCLVHPACRILASYTSDQTLLSELPRLGNALYRARLIKAGTIHPSYGQGEALMGEIQEAVCADYRKLEVFADILCKYTPTADIGRAIMRDYSKYMCYNIYQ